MKIKIKKRLNQIEEARTFEDATTKIGKYRKKLIAKVKDLPEVGQESPDKVADSTIQNMKETIPSEYQWEGKTYPLPDGERVQAFDWLKELAINNVNQILPRLIKEPLDTGIKNVLAQFMLSKKYAYRGQEKINSITDLNDIIELDQITSESFRAWKQKEEDKREKESLRSSDQNIEYLVSSDPNWEIAIPKDKQAAIYLGTICKSRWCTSARSTKNMFDVYDYDKKRDGPLFVFKHKTQKEKITVNRGDGKEIEAEVPLMYQIQFGREEFKDRNNNEVGEETKIVLLNLVQNSKTSNGKPTKEKYPIIETIKMFKRGEDIETIKNIKGDKIWLLNGQMHREDGPAAIKKDGTKEWYLNGELHRENGPAIEWKDGSKEWYLNDQRHREDGPAILFSKGTKNWYLNGKPYGRTGSNDMSTPKRFIEAGGKEWDWKNDPWIKRDNPIKMDFDDLDLDKFIPEHFRRFRKLWS